MAYTLLVDTHTLNQHLGDDQWIVFDCRFDLSDTEARYHQYLQSHIPGARYAHLDHHLSSPILSNTGRHPMPDMARLCEWLGQCGFDGSQQVVVYDDSHGAMAVRLWWLMKGLGHEAVAVLDGGWPAWQQQQFTVTEIVPEVNPCEFHASFDWGQVISTRQVEHNLTRNDFIMVDVRAHQRFTGENEPIDPVAGRIPGAVNQPLTDNVDEQGFFKPADQLQAMYQPLIQQAGQKPLIFMCGSGVTACHSVLALELAGFGRYPVYAGSFSEWIRDANHPVATGATDD